MAHTLDRLAAEGLPKKTPAAAIQWGTTGQQRTVLATMGDLAEAAAREKLAAPATIVVGECARLRTKLQWFERRPLFGKTIVVTRSRDNAEAFSASIRELGGEVIAFPTIETVPPDSYYTL